MAFLATEQNRKSVGMYSYDHFAYAYIIYSQGLTFYKCRITHSIQGNKKNSDFPKHKKSYYKTCLHCLTRSSEFFIILFNT